MPRRETEKLERRDIMLYAGDWEELRLLLAATRVTPTAFVRALVRRTIRRIQAAKAGEERPVEDIDEQLITNVERGQSESSPNIASERG